MIMERVLFIDAQPDYTRAAITENGILCEVMSEKQNAEDQTESIFLGRVQSIRNSIHAAFIDIGTDQNAFLPLDDDHTLRCGEHIIVQGAAKQATDSKGLRVQAKINLPGKWLVLIPESSGVHISKKIKDTALREELLALGQEICPIGCGMIIRTVSEEASEELLSHEAAALYDRWRNIQRKAVGMTRPGVISQKESVVMRLARDLKEITRIVVNQESIYDLLIQAQRDQRVSAETEIVLYKENAQLIFDAFSIENQIDKALKKRVWLPCGGYLIFDFCEALTVIDVNSGKMILGRNLEETALRVNLEAADEIARQLRLRDVGGIVVIDFIDMKREVDRKLLLERMKAAVKSDRTQVSVEGITRLGLLELTRKRANATLHKALRTSCSYCSGNGEVLSGEETARRALRQVRRLLISGQRGPFVVRCSSAAAQALVCMNAPEEQTVYACAVQGKHAEKYEIEQCGNGIAIPKEAIALK